MKVKFKKRGKDKIIMTLSHGLEIVVDRLEVLMIRDAVKEYLKTETGSFEVSGECYPRGAKKMVIDPPTDESTSCEQEVFKVFPVYHELPRERKANGLFLLKDWVQSELEKLIKE